MWTVGGVLTILFLSGKSFLGHPSSRRRSDSFDPFLRLGLTQPTDIPSEFLSPLKESRIADASHDQRRHKHSLTVKPLLDGKGLCNTIFQISTTSQGKAILKLYSDLAKLRLQSTPIVFRDGTGKEYASVDELVGELGLGPKILARSPNGILMEQLNGTCLTETDVHSSDSKPKLKQIASVLAALHALPIPADARSKNMLWNSLEVLLQRIPEATTRQSYAKRVQHQQDVLESLHLPIVIGHGDFKPSNVFWTSGNTVRLIDFETAGCHYRGYDLAKIFRTAHRTPWTVSNQAYFLECYQAATKLKSYDFSLVFESDIEDDVQRLLLESELLLPMTWLEAAIFFEAMLRDEPSDSQNQAKWQQLAKERLQKYEEACGDDFWEKVDIYRDQRT